MSSYQANLIFDNTKAAVDIFFHRNGEFKLSIPKDLLLLHSQTCNSIVIDFNMDIDWSILILEHIVRELKRFGYVNFTLLTNYLPFGRANKPESELGCTYAILDTFLIQLRKIGIRKVMTRDIHSMNFCFQPQISIDSDSFVCCMGKHIDKIMAEHGKNAKYLFISPDTGSLSRAREALHAAREKVKGIFFGKDISFIKQRTKTCLKIKFREPEILENENYHNRICIIVDDMVDSGKTIKAAINKVRLLKPKKIYVLATHCLNEYVQFDNDVTFIYEFGERHESRGVQWQG